MNYVSTLSVWVTLLISIPNYCKGELRDELVKGLNEYQSVFQNTVVSAEGSVSALVSVSGFMGGPSGQFDIAGKLQVAFDPERYRASVPVVIPIRNEIIKVECTNGYDGSTMIELLAGQGRKYSATKSCRDDPYHIGAFNCRSRGMIFRSSYICGLLVATSDFGRGSFLQPNDSYLKRFVREADEIREVDGGYIVSKTVPPHQLQIELRSQPELHCVSWTKGIARTTFKYAWFDGKWLPLETSRLVIEELKDGTPSVASREVCTISKWRFMPIQSQRNASFLPNIAGAEMFNDVCARETAAAKLPKPIAESSPATFRIPLTIILIVFCMVVVAFAVRWKLKHGST